MAKQTKIVGCITDVKRRRDGLVKYYVSYLDIKGNSHNVWTNWMTEQGLETGNNVQLQIVNRNANMAQFNNVIQTKNNKLQIALVSGACGFAAGCALCLAISTFSIVREIKPTIKMINTTTQKFLHKLQK